MRVGCTGDASRAQPSFFIGRVDQARLGLDVAHWLEASADHRAPDRDVLELHRRDFERILIKDGEVGEFGSGRGQSLLSSRFPANVLFLL